MVSFLANVTVRGFDRRWNATNQIYEARLMVALVERGDVVPRNRHEIGELELVSRRFEHRCRNGGKVAPVMVPSPSAIDWFGNRTFRCSIRPAAGLSACCKPPLEL